MTNFLIGDYMTTYYKVGGAKEGCIKPGVPVPTAHVQGADEVLGRQFNINLLGL